MAANMRHLGLGLAALLLLVAACTSSATGTSESRASPIATSVPAPVGTPSPAATLSPAPTGPESEASTAAEIPATPELPDDPTQLMRATLGGNVAAIARKMVASENLAYIPVLLEFMRVQSAGEARVRMASFINKLLEGPESIIIPPERTNWDWWIEWLGQNPQVQPPEGFAAWKGDMYSTIDPGLGSFLYDGVKTEIRLEEIVWGGVAKGGIPDLTNPPVISPNEVDYLEPDDRIFGVSINGEHRAYPLRILNLHEMANDVLGGVPFALTY